MKDIFICHASEDKANVVYPLVKKLECLNVSYWLDKAEIRWGDSITQKVNDGLIDSKYVIVVLSKSFLNKNWPKRELNAILNIEASNGETKILPLIYGNSNEILQKLPLLNDKMFLSWDDGIDSIGYELKRKLDDSFQHSSIMQDEIAKDFYNKALLKMNNYLFDDAKKILASYNSEKSENINIKLAFFICELAEKPLHLLRREHIDTISRQLNSDSFYKEPLAIYLLAIIHFEYYKAKNIKPIGINSKELFQKTKEFNITNEDTKLLKFIKLSEKTSILLKIF